MTYRSVEHYFQAQKTLDPLERADVRSAPTPVEAKARGKQVTLRADWEQVKFDVMRVGVREKFVQNPVLKQRLLDTGDEELQEGNHWRDAVWGIDEATGQGQNWLGRILMETREQLRKEGA